MQGPLVQKVISGLTQSDSLFLPSLVASTLIALEQEGICSLEGLANPSHPANHVQWPRARPIAQMEAVGTLRGSDLPEDHHKGLFTSELNLITKGKRYLYSQSERYPHGRPDHPIIGSRGEHRTAPALRSINSFCSVFQSSALDPREQEEFVQFQKTAESGSGPPHCHISADTATGKGEIFVVVHGVPPDRSGRQTPQFARAALICKLLAASPTEAS